MGKNRKNMRQDSVVNYRAAEPVEPDPVRRLNTFLIAIGIVASCLVLADAIEYMVRPPQEEKAPIMLGLVNLEGDVEDKDRGEQKIEPEKKKPKIKPQKPEKEQKPAEEPPATVKALNEKPAGPAETDNAHQQVGIIATRDTGPGPSSLFSNRRAAAKRKALGKYGGNAKTESAVRRGLKWLVRHQDDDGKWSRTHFDRHCKPGGPKCGGTGFSPTKLDPAITGLAVLCFCASNITHRKGEFKDNVAAAIEYLRRIQTKNGQFGEFPRALNYYMMYNQGIATFALAELCAMTGDQSLRPTVEKAVKFIVRAQQMSGGWDYTDAKTGRYDTSVTGWQVMALKSAQAAGVEIPPYTIYKLARFLANVTLPTGEVIYANKAPGAGRRGQGMAAVGLASAQFLGFSDHTRSAKWQISIILSHPPDWGKLDDQPSLNSIYYWYYATIALFQTGGQAWDRWNSQLKQQLLLHQRRGGCLDGSWDPPNNFWGKIGGRMYATTLNILNLEIYYRYLPLYSGGTIKTVDALIETAEGDNQTNAAQAVRLLGKFDDRKAHNFLLRLAHSYDHAMAMEASLALAARKDPAAIGPLLNQLRSSNQWERYRALRAMMPMMGQGLVPVFIHSLRDEKPTVARQAALALRQYANVSFGFEPETPAREREEAIRKWSEWWENQKNGVVTAKSSPVWLVLSVRADKGLVAFSTGKPGLAKATEKYNVYRGDRYIGRINVLSVKGVIAIGKILERYSTGEFKEGDVVKLGG